MELIRVVLVCGLLICECSAFDLEDEVLAYPYKQHGRYKRSQDDCVRFPYQNRTHVLFPAHTGPALPVMTADPADLATVPELDNFTTTTTLPTINVEKGLFTDSVNLSISEETTENVVAKITTQPLEEEIVNNTRPPPPVEIFHSMELLDDGSHYALYHIAYINDPSRTVSIYEPLHDGTCKNGSYRRATVMESAKSRNCILAVNAGFFNTKNGACYGNIVSDSKIVQNSEGIQNAHFGITKSGELFFGYLSENDLIGGEFTQLVGGVIWAIKDGEIYIQDSIASECVGSQETGTLEVFANVTSSRTLVGHDKYGRVVILQVEGKTRSALGIDLYKAAEIMKKYGVINAINLDGGGSSTMVINDTLVNYPTDKCKPVERFRCMREVSTVLCVHAPFCPSADCSGHGSCDYGQCHCHGYWKGDNCDVLECPEDCSGHGVCTEDGCLCSPGYHGDACSKPCPAGWYDVGCSRECVCDNNATCDPHNGSCQCLSGYTGPRCQYRCLPGYFGINCSTECSCDNSSSCDPASGACNYTYSDTDILQAGPCLAKQLKKENSLKEDSSEENQTTVYVIIVVSTVALLSIILNIVLLLKWRCTAPKAQ